MSTTRIKLNEGETARIIRDLPNRVAVDLSFGPRGVWLDVANPENEEAVKLLCGYRGVPYPSRIGSEDLENPQSVANARVDVSTQKEKDDNHAD